MGTIFWLIVIYSLLGYALFVAVSSLIAKRLTLKQEINGAEESLFANLIILLLVLSGPLSWGMMIRGTLRLSESDSQT
jgi:hypothetical protein